MFIAWLGGGICIQDVTLHDRWHHDSCNPLATLRKLFITRLASSADNIAQVVKPSTSSGSDTGSPVARPACDADHLGHAMQPLQSFTAAVCLLNSSCTPGTIPTVVHQPQPDLTLSTANCSPLETAAKAAWQS